MKPIIRKPNGEKQEIAIRTNVLNVRRVSSISSMVADARETLAFELSECRRRAIEQQKTMDGGEAFRFSIFVKTLATLAEEERKQERADTLSKLGDEELEQLVMQALNNKSTPAEANTAEQVSDDASGGKRKREKPGGDPPGSSE